MRGLFKFCAFLAGAVCLVVALGAAKDIGGGAVLMGIVGFILVFGSFKA